MVFVGVKGSEAAFVAAGYLDKWVKRGVLGMGTAMLMGKGKHLKANKVKVSADRYTAAGDAGGYPVKAEAAVKTGRHRWGLALAGGRGQNNDPPPAMAVGIARSNVDTNTPYASLLAQCNNNNNNNGSDGNGGNDGGNDGGNGGRVCWGIWLHTRDRDWLKNQEQEQDAQEKSKAQAQEQQGGQEGEGAAGGAGSGEAGSSSNNCDSGDVGGDGSNGSDGNNNNNNNNIGGGGGDDDGERHRAGGPDAFMLPCDATVELDCDAGTLSIGIGAAASGDDDAQMEMTVVSRNLPKNQPMSLVCTTHDETCSMKIVSYETAVGAK